ncbi:MAG: hypothetical protein GY809_33110 [Planctomycetes bacterium]|nr:hypothetical protein [Planctomycetota bacterium]
MTNQLRVWKVLLVLLVSMTSGAIILMALGNNAPSSGAFCLSSYYQLESAETAVTSRTKGAADRWSRIEVFYSQTKGGDISWLAARSGLSDEKDLNCHFVICNGLGGHDGDILKTEKWQTQTSVVPLQNWYGVPKTIRICVVADGEKSLPTDCQIKRAGLLVHLLIRQFGIAPKNVLYPGDLSKYASTAQ